MILVIYHANCLDGFAAALVYYRAVREQGMDVTYLAASYGGKAPEDLSKYDSVRIVDFSYSRETLLKMKEQVNDLLVLDHHKTAQTELEGLEFAKFDMNRSGCVMAWEEVNPHLEVPLFLQHIQDRDLWRFQMEGTKEICAGLRTVPFDFERWMPFLDGSTDLEKIGHSILEYDAQIMKAVKVLSGSMDGLNGQKYRIPVANIAWLWSEVGETILASPVVPNPLFSATFYFIEPNKVKWSLRSRSSFDVSEIARAHGGGGHAQAAGFVSDAKFLNQVLGI